MATLTWRQTLVWLVCASLGAGCASTSARSAAPTDERFFELALVWIADPQAFQAYGQAVGPVAARYGGGLETMVAPSKIYAEQMKAPTLANVVFYRDKAARAAMEADADFKRLKAQRDTAAQVISLAGPSRLLSPPSPPKVGRIYVIEVARFGPGGQAAYAAYEREAGPVLKAHGYHPMRAITPEIVEGFPFKPDLIRVGYWESAEGLAAMQKDPTHTRLEKELYPAAVAESIWILGGAPPVPGG